MPICAHSSELMGWGGRKQERGRRLEVTIGVCMRGSHLPGVERRQDCRDIQTEYGQASKLAIFHAETLGSREEGLTVELAVGTWEGA